MSEQHAGSGRARVRLWPLALLVVALLLLLAWIWADADADRQQKVVATMLAAVFGGFAAVLWLLLLSRLPGRVRLTALAAIVLAVVAARLTLRIEGVDGDMVPILAWRWAAKPSERIAAVPPPVGSAALVTGSYPEFLGEGRRGSVAGVRLATEWKPGEPRILWHRPIGEGWSGFAVEAGLAVTQLQDGPNEIIAAFTLQTGEERWRYAYPARYFTVIAGAGPRSVPTIRDGRVFAAGATGVLTCLELETGRLLWQRNVLEDNGGQVPSWGMSVSPLVTGGRVVVSTGGAGRALAAYDALSGEPVWSAGDGGLSYASPQLNVLGGVGQIVMFDADRVAGHDPDTGAVLWEHPWRRGQPNVAQPLQVGDDQLILSAGYGIGSKSIRVRRTGENWTAELDWETPRMKSKFSNLILHDGFVYGMDDGIMACLDPASGRLKWKRGRFTHSQLLLAAELLLVWTETSELILVDPDPEGLRELARVRVFEEKSWNPPALAGQLLLLRNHREAAALVLPILDQMKNDN